MLIAYKKSMLLAYIINTFCFYIYQDIDTVGIKRLRYVNTNTNEGEI